MEKKKTLVLILNPGRIVRVFHICGRSDLVFVSGKTDCRTFSPMSLAALCNLCMIECQWSFVIWKAVFLFALSLVLPDSLV